MKRGIGRVKDGTGMVVKEDKGMHKRVGGHREWERRIKFERK